MSEETQSLDDVFNGNDPEPAKEPEPQEPEPEQDKPTAETDAEPEKEPEKETEAPAASEESDSELWTKTAVLDERRKRQALEAEIAELKQTKEAQQEPEKIPDVFESQDDYTRYLSSQVDQKTQNIKLEMSAEMMRMQDSEYDVKESEFMAMAKDNPSLAQKALTHAMPAKFVVDTVNKSRELKKLENVDEYKATLKAEMEAEIRKEIEAEMSEKQAQNDKVSSIKPSLANARSSGDSKTSLGNESLDELFGGR